MCIPTRTQLPISCHAELIIEAGIVFMEFEKEQRPRKVDPSLCSKWCVCWTEGSCKGL